MCKQVEVTNSICRRSNKEGSQRQTKSAEHVERRRASTKPQV